MDKKLMYSRSEAAQMVGVSVRMIDLAIADGSLVVKRLGTRVLISQAALDQFLAPQPSKAYRRRRKEDSHV